MNERYDPIDQRAAGLPDAIEPEQDLWPEIANALVTPATVRPKTVARPWTYAIAAGLALAVVSSSLTWWIANRPAVGSEQIVAAIIGQPTLFMGDAEMLEVRQQLTASLDESLNRLNPRTRREVGLNLLEIHQSLAEVRLALAEDPENVFLHQLLHTMYRQELDLLNDINKLASDLPAEIQT